ncbi:MAG: BspA family leucine-rich repeat surface protein [Bacteroidales bacterium]|nr:BspA family leucine-rich repeat surface protein [Bacteroidales bacterium]
MNYCNSESYRDTIIIKYNWTVSGDAQSCEATDYFITTWKTDNSGTSGSTEITIPTNSSYTYNYDVDWNNDGVFDEFGLTGSVTHDFGTAGTYTIRIKGNFPAIYFNYGSDYGKITSIDQWGTIKWHSMENAFWGCENLVYNATDAPDLSNATNISNMFAECSLIAEEDFSNWDVSTIADFSGAFSYSSFNGDVSTWDMNNAINLEVMFAGSFFAGDVSEWDVGNVTNMRGMFSGCVSFNSDITLWNTGNVTNMELMFYSTDVFNQDVSTWNVSSVTNMNSMFNGADSLNQNLGSWDITSVSSFLNMFTGTNLSTENYDGILEGWAAQTVQANKNLGTVPASYCSAREAHKILTDTYGWTINDEGQQCDDSTHFIITVQTDSTGTSGSTEFTIPTNSSYTYNYDVDWNNDGIFDTTGVTGDIIHDFGTAGTYTIRIQGTFPAIYFNTNGDCQKLISIDQWGSISWESMENAFAYCSNLQYKATDAPDLSNATSIFRMFGACSLIAEVDLSNWDVSTITDFSWAFVETSFNGDVSTWDMSNAINLELMFASSAFNGDVSKWDVSNVTNMNGLFYECESFNQDISVWNTAKVTNMSYMFYGAHAFNQDISAWNVSSVTKLSSMFNGADVFNQDISGWDISNVSNMSNMLNSTAMSTQNYDKLLSSWSALDINSDITLGAAGLNYCNAENYRDTLTTKYGWTITDDGQSCEGSDHFITTWQTDSTGTSSDTEITIPTNSSYTYNYNVDWDNDGTFDEFNITGDVTHDFGTAGTYTIRIQGTFPAIYFNNMGDFQKLISIDQWGTIQWESMEKAFCGCDNLQYNATDAPDLSNVTSLARMFKDACSFTGDLSNWDVSNIIDFTQLFMNTPFNGDISNWDVSEVTDMKSMFRYCKNFNQDISSWNTSKVTNMEYMFANDSAFNQDISAWDVGNVIKMKYMFENAEAFNQDISEWDVSSVINFTNMFQNATSFNQDVSGWDIGAANSIESMFEGATSFNQNIGLWDISHFSGNDMYNVLNNTNLSTTTYDAILYGWTNWAIEEYLDLGTINASYCKGQSDKMSLTSGLNWSITDNGLEADGPVPDAATLSDIFAECEVTTLTAPTATDECTDTVYITHNAVLPITTQGTTVVTWTYTDDNGNTATQTQNVIIDDVTAPVADVSTLDDIEAECEVSTLTAPTATDNCVGTITGTHDASLPIITQGTTIVTWTYDDGNGNTSTQTQNVVIKDVTAPVADASTLGEIEAECEVTSLTNPTATDNCSDTVYISNDATLPITEQGVTIVTWTFTDASGNTTTQEQFISLNDYSGPVPDVVSLDTIYGINEVTELTAPTATDNCSGAAFGTHNITLPITTEGTTEITWEYEDASGNTSEQTQYVVITIDDEAPVPDVEILSDINAECIVTELTAPTATDNVSGTLTGVHDASLPITNSTTITWTYTDNSGNSSTQTQEVIIDDVTAPTPDVAGLTGITAECEVTELTAPTATDNCEGTITGTHDATLPITSSTSITWTYTDAAGNSSTQTQEVVIDDVTAPVADLESLPVITAECEVTELTAPTATDNCEGTIIGTMDISLPITTQGTTIVTWTYEDASGNTSTQTQNILIEDVTAPTISCIENQEIEITSDIYVVQETEFDPIEVFDNCEITSITNNINNIETLAGEELSIGTQAVEWTIIDKAGNSASCIYNISISKITSIGSTNFSEIQIYPNPTSDFFIVKTNQQAEIRIYDRLGQIVQVAATNEQISMQGFSQGLYFIKVEGHIQIFKVIKQ